MSFFKKKINVSTVDTVLGEGIKFEGKISTQASIHIHGEILGNIAGQGDVLVGNKGRIQSNIEARDIFIAGEVKGNVIATQKLMIASTGKLVGDSKSASLLIEEGGVFSGKSDMGNSTPTV